MLRVPFSTYRLQLHNEFTFDDAAALAPYLHDLGISHVYCSPYLQAAQGSMHGYDVVSHQRVNLELGGAEGHERFSAKLTELGMGQVLDIVPNHLSLGKENRYWWDVLENGTSSRYASFFDIDWQPAEERLRDKILVPILEDPYMDACCSEVAFALRGRGTNSMWRRLDRHCLLRRRQYASDFGLEPPGVCADRRP